MIFSLFNIFLVGYMALLYKNWRYFSLVEKEKVLLVGCQLNRYSDERYAYSMDELASLTKTAQGEVMMSMVQKRERVHPATYIGKGKLEEIKALEEELEIDLIIFNDELSTGQIRNLSNELEARVIDRTQLILDIFAQRANSREGKLQVELAQLEYMLPRLIGIGASLSRLGGGIGTRGPGETKLETDRRHIHRRIDEIKRHIKSVAEHRVRYRERRKKNQTFQIALVGYTNAGKSTLFNRLTQADTYEENQLFATLDPMTRQMQLPSGLKVLLTDTVGFIEDLPTSLIAAFKSTLEEVKEADLMIHVVDASNPDYSTHEKTVSRILEDLDALQIPIITIYNKKDLLTDNFLPSFQSNFGLISAYDSNDIKQLLGTIEEKIKEQMEFYHFHIASNNGKWLAGLKSSSILMSQHFNEETGEYECKGFINPNLPLYQEIKSSKK